MSCYSKDIFKNDSVSCYSKDIFKNDSVSCTNNHHDITDLVNHGMVKSTKTCG